MKCYLFGHKFGKIENKYQYCTVCGLAKSIHPCTAGHMWKDTGEPNLVTTTTQGSYYSNNFIETKIVQIPQKCIVCGERRSAKQY